MKIVHIESGLGNQMLSYCELLALRLVNPQERLYIETLVYDFPEASKVIRQWQGYELERVFGIKEPNISEIFTDRQWSEIKNNILESEFWNKSWNWPVYFTEAFRKQGIILRNLRGDFEDSASLVDASIKGKLRKNPAYQRFQKTWLYSNLRGLASRAKGYEGNDLEYLFYPGEEDALTGQKLSFMKRNNHIEMIENMIRSSFSFPPLSERYNILLAKELSGTESVAVHIRRGDLLDLNYRYYKGGYFKRAVKFVQRKFPNSKFYFFCDSGSADWCKKNIKVFGLDLLHGNVRFVDCNYGDKSFRDMQLMSYCKHNIVTISSFGWWGAYLNRNPNKITISPEIDINTTHHL